MELKVGLVCRDQTWDGEVEWGPNATIVAFDADSVTFQDEKGGPEETLSIEEFFDEFVLAE